MTTEVQEENANHYNMKKSWHTDVEKKFDTADGVYFEKPKAKKKDAIPSEPVEQEAEQASTKDEHYKRPE